MTIKPYGSTKRWRGLVLTLAMAGGLLAMVGGLRAQYARWLAAHWRKQLETAADDQAAQLLHQAAGLGQPGIAVLVEALGSERQSVAQAARRVLRAEMRRWEALRARQSSPKLAALARALADRVDQFGPTARADAADLAARILYWPLDNRAVDRTEVIASCHAVLRATSPDHGQLARGRPPEGPAHVAAAGSQRTAQPDGRNGGSPLETSPAGETSPSGGGSSRSAPPAALSLDQPQRLLSVPETVEPAPLFAGPAKVPQASNPPLPEIGTLGSERPDTAGDWGEGDDRSIGWAGTETVEVMRRLQAEDDSLAAAAEVELKRRGFSPVHVELARQLFDPAPRVRRQLARVLPELGSVDAVPWLMWLCRDEDAEVRRVAITLMATTGDPTLLAELEQIARRDPDPGIQRQAERIARQRQEKSAVRSQK